MVSAALLPATPDEDAGSDQDADTTSGQDADKASDQGGGSGDGGGKCFIQAAEGSIGAFWLFFIVMGVIAAVGIGIRYGGESKMIPGINKRFHLQLDNIQSLYNIWSIGP
jgi:hypothetical protein